MYQVLHQLSLKILLIIEENGPIKHHKEISSIKRLGAKTFEQSIGFKNC